MKILALLDEEIEAAQEFINTNPSALRIVHARRSLSIARALKLQVEKHFPLRFNESRYCAECKVDGDGNMIWFPCPFIREVANAVWIAAWMSE